MYKFRSSCIWFSHNPLLRVTLIGSIQEADEATATVAAAAHRERFANAMGVDAPSDNDSFFRLVIDRAFYVGGMGSAARAEVLSAEQLAQYVSRQTAKQKEMEQDGMYISVICLPITSSID